MKKYYLLFGVLSVMVVAAAFFGWSNSTKSFSFSDGSATDGSVSFKYPENMENMENYTSSSLIIGSEDWKVVGDLSNDEIGILIQKNLGVRPIDARNNQDGVREHGGEFLSKTDETNPAGVEVFKSISAIPDSDSNNTLKYYDMLFKDNSGATYCISIYGYDTEDAELSATADMIFNSLKLG